MTDYQREIAKLEARCNYLLAAYQTVNSALRDVVEMYGPSDLYSHRAKEVWKRAELALNSTTAQSISNAASILGSQTSSRKAKTSAENGKLGGRPRKPKS